MSSVVPYKSPALTSVLRPHPAKTVSRWTWTKRRDAEFTSECMGLKATSQGHARGKIVSTMFCKVAAAKVNKHLLLWYLYKVVWSLNLNF